VVEKRGYRTHTSRSPTGIFFCPVPDGCRWSVLRIPANPTTPSPAGPGVNGGGQHGQRNRPEIVDDVLLVRKPRIVNQLYNYPANEDTRRYRC